MVTHDPHASARATPHAATWTRASSPRSRRHEVPSPGLEQLRSARSCAPSLTLLSILVAFVLFGLLCASRRPSRPASTSPAPIGSIVRHKVSLIQPLPVSLRRAHAADPGRRRDRAPTWFGGIYQDEPKNFFASIPGRARGVPGDVSRSSCCPRTRRRPGSRPAPGPIVGRTLAERFGWKIGDRIPLIIADLAAQGRRGVGVRHRRHLRRRRAERPTHPASSSATTTSTRAAPTAKAWSAGTSSASSDPDRAGPRSQRDRRRVRQLALRDQDRARGRVRPGLRQADRQHRRDPDRDPRAPCSSPSCSSPATPWRSRCASGPRSSACSRRSASPTSSVLGLVLAEIVPARGRRRAGRPGVAWLMTAGGSPGRRCSRSSIFRAAPARRRRPGARARPRRPASCRRCRRMRLQIAAALAEARVINWLSQVAAVTRLQPAHDPAAHGLAARGGRRHRRRGRGARRRALDRRGLPRRHGDNRRRTTSRSCCAAAPTREMMSGLAREERPARSPTRRASRRGPDGPLASAELFVIINLPKRIDRHRRQRAAARRRGGGASGARRRRIVEGRMFEPAGTRSSSASARPGRSPASTWAARSASARTSGRSSASSRRRRRRGVGDLDRRRRAPARLPPRQHLPVGLRQADVAGGVPDRSRTR